VHFESRTVDPMAKALRELTQARQAGHEVFMSVEIERPRPIGEVADLIPLADVAVLSRDYIVHHQKLEREAALTSLESRVRNNSLLVLPWGSQGASASLKFRTNNGEVVFLRANVPAAELTGALASTLGAGDTFNAALCFACARSRDLRLLWSTGRGTRSGLQRAIILVLEFAHLIAALKCCQPDFDLSPTLRDAELKLTSRLGALDAQIPAAL